MRTLVFLLFSLLSIAISAQDTIVKLDGERIVGKVQEVTPEEVKVYKTLIPEGPLFVLSKAGISYIRYSNGDIEQFSEMGESLGNTAMYDQGKKDAKMYYKGYKTAGTTILVVSALYPLGGFYPALGCGFTRPKPKNFNAPNTVLLNNPDYSKGYSDEAYRIKRNKVWANFGIGTAISFGLIIAIVATSLN